MNRVDVAEYLYTKMGLSSYKVAEILKVTPESIRQTLKKRGVGRRRLGKDIEDIIEKWCIKSGFEITRQKENSGFDFLINGKRVDVKSAQKTRENKRYRYYFQLKDLSNSSHNYKDWVDTIWLVFLNEPGMPIYSLDLTYINVRHGISIASPNKSKYPIDLIGYLERRK